MWSGKMEVVGQDKMNLPLTLPEKKKYNSQVKQKQKGTKSALNAQLCHLSYGQWISTSSANANIFFSWITTRHTYIYIY